MPACAVSGCPALADDPWKQCAIHRKYQLMPDQNRLKPLLCGRCLRKIRKGEWYEPRFDAPSLHMKACKPASTERQQHVGRPAGAA